MGVGSETKSIGALALIFAPFTNLLILLQRAQRFNYSANKFQFVSVQYLRDAIKASGELCAKSSLTNYS